MKNSTTKSNIKANRKKLVDLLPSGMPQMALGTGLATGIFDTSSKYLLNAGLQGLGDIFGGHPNLDGSMYSSIPEGGQLLAMGGLIGDPPVRGKTPVYDPTKAPTYDRSLLTGGKFLVNKPDGSLAQWGNPVPPAQPVAPVIVPGIAPLPISDKAKGTSSTYYPAAAQRVSKTPDAIPYNGYAMGGTVPHIPVEVEGDEVAHLPNGQVGQFQGPDHEDGGIPVHLPERTKVYSDRLSMDGKTMAERKLARERSINKLTKILDKNPTDALNRNTFKRSKDYADLEEQQDLQLQQAATQIYQKPQQGQPQQMQQMTDPSQLNLDPAQPQQFATGTGGDGVPGPLDYMSWLSPQARKGLLIPAVNQGGYNNPMGYSTPDSPDSMMEDSTQDRPDSSGVKTTAMPYTTGDKLGFLGNTLNGALPLAATLANRAGDKPNVNSFENFGKAAIDSNSEGMGFLNTVKNNNLANLRLETNGQRARNRNSATGVNTLRALDIATSGEESKATGNAYSSYAQQMAGMYNEKSKLQNQQDLYKDTGAHQADVANREDRDNYYTQLGTNLGNLGHLTQMTGKEMNEHQQANDELSLIPLLNRYGLGFTYDKNGNKTLTKIAS